MEDDQKQRGISISYLSKDTNKIAVDIPECHAAVAGGGQDERSLVATESLQTVDHVHVSLKLTLQTCEFTNNECVRLSILQSCHSTRQYIAHPASGIGNGARVHIYKIIKRQRSEISNLTVHGHQISTRFD